MKREFFLRALGGIDDDLLIEAFAENQQNKTVAKNRKIYWRWGVSVAACLLVGVSVWAAVPSVFMKASDNMAPEAAILPGDVHGEVLFDAAVGIVPTDDADGDLKTEAASGSVSMNESLNEQSVFFIAKITEVNESSLLVEVTDKGSTALNRGTAAYVSTAFDAYVACAVGDSIRVEFDGLIQEVYPLIIPNVISISKHP